jgi:hypothetical protein
MTASNVNGSSLNDKAAVMLAAAQERFIQNNPRSRELHEKAVECFPGGTTRSLLQTYPFPLRVKSGKGYQLIDEDGHTYIVTFCDADRVAVNRLVGMLKLRRFRGRTLCWNLRPLERGHC